MRLSAVLAAAMITFSAVSRTLWTPEVQVLDPLTVRIVYQPVEEGRQRYALKNIPFKMLRMPESSEQPQVTSVRDTRSIVTSAGLVVTQNRNGITISNGPGTTVETLGPGVQDDGRLTLSLRLSSSAPVYGAGERGHKLNLEGDTLINYNRQNYGYTDTDPRISQMGITMPMLVSPDGFALIFDDFAESSIVMPSKEKNSSVLTYSTIGTRGPLSVVYTASERRNLAGAVSRAATLTGRQQMPPLWALGYITSKYGYKTQAETLAVVDSLISRGYPLDGVVLDLYWYGKEQDMGALSWQRDGGQWPEPEKMIAELASKGVRLVNISQPYVLKNGRGIDNYNFLAANGMLLRDSLGEYPQFVKIWVGEGGMLDVANPDTRDWLKEQYMKQARMGVAGFWGDLGEPEVHPLGALHSNGFRSEEYHNRYGNEWASVIAELHRDSLPGVRPLTLMRGGTLGLQRHNVFPWSTDVSRSWGGLRPQVNIMLNSGLSGLGYMSHDVGGFAIDGDNPVDPELYVRWLQLGLYSPVLRTHSQFAAEPYHYPDHQETIRNLIRDRYRLLPYTYTLAAENAAFGTPLVRPLQYIENGLTEDIPQEFLYGSNILVAPVVEQGQTSRNVYFPAGFEWREASDLSKVYPGGHWQTVAAPLEKIPVFYRSGAIIPTAEYHMQNTGDYKTDNYTLTVVPLAPSQQISQVSTIFEDDLSTPSDGISGSNLLAMYQVRQKGTLELRIDAVRLDFMPDITRQLEIRFPLTARPARILFNGNQLKKGVKYDSARRLLTLSLPVTFAERGARNTILLEF